MVSLVDSSASTSRRPITIRKRLLSANYSSSDKLYRNTGTRVELVSPKYCVKNGLRLGESLRLGENWVQPNGRLKNMACRELLLTLNRRSLITLPPRLASTNNNKRNQSLLVIEIDQAPFRRKTLPSPSC
jgi:hypothetical protein